MFENTTEYLSLLKAKKDLEEEIEILFRSFVKSKEIVSFTNSDYLQKSFQLSIFFDILREDELEEGLKKIIPLIKKYRDINKKQYKLEQRKGLDGFLKNQIKSEMELL